MERDGCGLDTVLDVIAGKWKAPILWELRERPLRFGQLRRRVAGITEKVLVQQLRAMEERGLITREEFDEVPPRVQYALTPLGVSLYETLVPVCEWGERSIPD
ncbi:helix-turn-helix domain-containing protein [Actinomycetes bacterium KLBMP 9759]